MALLTATDLSLVLGGKPLLAGAALRLLERDRVGLVGPNGSGKSTLLRILAGQVEPDSGELHRRRDLRVGYLPQMAATRRGLSLLALVRESVPAREGLLRQAADLERDLASAAGDEELLELSGELAEVTDTLAAWEARFGDHVAAQILSGLGFSPADLSRDVGELSGGWQMRAQLGALLLAGPDVLLLDEPTNHLDLPATAWLGGFLGSYRKSYLIVCHDREFLNDHVGRVISFEPEGLRSWSGNFEAYLEARALERELAEARATHLARERAHAERFIERFRYKASKARAVQSRIKALGRMEQVAAVRGHDTIDFSFPPCRRTGDPVLTILGLAKSYGSHRVLSGVELTVRRGDRIAIIGPNGAGKSTLLRMLGGELESDAGTLRWGVHADVGFHAQHHGDALAAGDTVLAATSAAAPAESPARLRSLLGALLFSGDDVDKRVGVLSGGERARVALARLLVRQHNVLLMDEPTNHLDLDSCDALAAALDTFDGTLLFVSHNLAFIRSLATRIWSVSGGGVENYPGTLDEYVASSARRAEEAAASASPSAVESRGDSERDRRRRAAQERARRKERLGPIEARVAALESEIAALETEQKRRSELLARPETYGSPEGGALARDYQRDAARLEELTEEWAGVMTEKEQAERELAGA